MTDRFCRHPPSDAELRFHCLSDIHISVQKWRATVSAEKVRQSDHQRLQRQAWRRRATLASPTGGWRSSSLAVSGSAIRGLTSIVILLLLVGSSVAGGTAGAAKWIRIVFRFDDPSAVSDTEIEVRLIETFRQYRYCCTWAVIPFRASGDIHDQRPMPVLPLPAEKAEIFAEAARAGVLEIALHGYSHQSRGLQRGRHSEFVGLGYDEQRSRIERGKEYLQGVMGLPVTIFVPPWNTYDAHTLAALEASGFGFVSADARGRPGPGMSLALLPATCSLVEVREAVASARTAPDASPIITVLFHVYDFREVDASQGVTTFEEFVETLQWLSRQPDVRIVPMADVMDLNWRRYRDNQRIRMWPLRLPPLVRGRGLPPQVFWSSEGIRSTGYMPRLVLRFVAFYGGVAAFWGVVSFLVAGVVFSRRTPAASRFLLSSGPVLLACSLLWLVSAGHFGGRIRMLVAVLSAAAWCAGTCAAWMRRTHGLAASRCAGTVVCGASEEGTGPEGTSV